MTTPTPNLATLLSRSSLHDDEDLLASANTALSPKSKTPLSDSDRLQALHVKAVALLRLDRFQEALAVYEKEGLKAGEGEGALAFAYALYKTGRQKEAAEVAAKAAGVVKGSRRERGLKMLEAQALYRAEDFVTAASIYASLLKSSNTTDPEINDLRINQSATDAQLVWQRTHADKVSKKKPTREDLEAFETAYNAACACLARGEWGQAEMLLKRSKELCKHSEDLTEEEIAAELLPITVQQIYVLTRLEKLEEAAQLSESITIETIPDLSTKTIAQNNALLTSGKPSNPFIAHKIFHSTPTSTGNDKVFDFQASIFTANSYGVDAAALKYDGVARSTAKAIAKSSSPTLLPSVNTLSVLNAAAHARNATGKQGLKEVLPLLEQRPSDVGLVLTVVQLYVLEKKHAAAISVLESFFKRLEESVSEQDKDVRYSPGLVGTLVALYKHQSQTRNAKSELAKASAHWQSTSTPPTTLLKAAGLALLETSSDAADLKAAGAIFDQLRASDPKDAFANAGFVASFAVAEPEKVKSQVSSLTPVSSLIENIDINALIKAGIPSTPHPTTTLTSKKRPAPTSSTETKPTEKKIGKSRLPKDYDPAKKPDPERWLPMKDRSYYRAPKSRKAKAKAEKGGTQGGVVDDVQVEVQQAQKSAGGGNKKKKGKGKK